MRVIILVFTTISSYFCCNYSNKIIEREKIIYELYTNNFKEFIEIEENIIRFDKNKIKSHLESKGYAIEFYDDSNLFFNISFKHIKKCEKEYYFYVVKSNEN